MKVCIDIDDYHSFPKWDCSDVILKILDVFPDMKFTIFFTPFMKNIPLTDYPQALDRIIELVEKDVVEIFLHGLTHKKRFNGEFGLLNKNQIRKRIFKSASYLKKAHIPFKEGIKFPWNLYNKKVLEVLEDINYILFTNKLEKDFNGRQIVWKNSDKVQKRYVQTADYRYCKPSVPDKNSIIYYHSHAQNMRKNGIRESYKNFIEEIKELQKIEEVKFIFCSNLIQY